MTRSWTKPRGERLRRRFGDDRDFVGAALGSAASFPSSLLVTGPFDRGPASAVNVTVVCVDILLGILVAASRPIQSDATFNRRPAQAGVRGH